MTPRPGLKWNSFESDVIGAWVAEMDFGLAPAITEALHAAVDRADTGYPYPAAWNAVAETASVFWAGRFGWRVDPGRVFHVPDVVEGLRRAVMHLTAPGSPVILHPPIYHPFFTMVAAAGREHILVRSYPGEDGRWCLDLDGIDRAFAAGAGSIVLCNPWNPVGRSLTASEVSDVVAVAERHGGRVVADEIHAPLTFPGHSHVVAAGLSPATVVTVTAATKAWNLPGLKAAQVVLTNDHDVDVWSRHFVPHMWGVGTFGLLASAAAYRDGTSWLEDVLARLEAKRATLGSLLAELLPGGRYTRPEATYLAWVDLSAYGWDPPGAVLLERARVAVSEGALFGPGGEGHVRVNFAMDDGLLVEMVERIAAIV
ncbi:MAG TPA: aminotransferase class I/II-fold pyridoxal phosphate-dependent enzyme [Acidimicrobiia bacterium]